MPDSFGNLTPQEVQQQILQQQQARLSAAFANNPSGFGKAGIGIGNAIGGLFRKRGVTRDTEAARKSEAQLLADQGFSTQEARAMAKQNVPRGSAKVQQALKIQEAGTIGQRTYDDLQGKIGHERARAAQMTVTAAQLRRFGFPEEATNITLQAVEERRTEEKRQLGVDQLNATLADTLSQTEDRGKSETGRLIDDMEITREEITAEIEGSNDPQEIANLQAELSYQQGRAHVLTTRHDSLSDADERALSKSGMNSVQLQQLDSKLLDAEFGHLERIILENKGKLSSTKIGAWGAGFASYLEGLAGIDPGAYGADTLITDVVNYKGTASLVSSFLRHTLTGAAMSPMEQPLMEPFLPTPGDSSTVMLAKAGAVRAYTRIDIATRQAFLDQYLASDNAGNRFPTADQVPPGLVTVMGSFQRDATLSAAQDEAPGNPLNDRVQQAIDAANN